MRLLLLTAIWLVTFLLIPARAADGPATAPAGSAPASAPAGPLKDGPAFRCDKPIHTFGEVWAGEVIQHVFVIANDGNEPLHLLNVTPDCSCTLAEDYTRVIPPGQLGTIPVTLTTARGSRIVDKKVVVETNDPIRPIERLYLRGLVKNRIDVDPVYGASFGNQTSGKPMTRTVRLQNNTDTPMKLRLAPIDEKAFYTVELREIEAGRTAELIITSRPQEKEGHYTGTITLDTGLADEPQLLVAASMNVPPPLTVITTAFEPYNRPDQPDRRTMLVSYNREGEFKLTSVEAGDPRIQVQVLPREPNRSYFLKVTIPAGFEAPESGAIPLTIHTNLPNILKYVTEIRPRRLATQPSTAPAQAVR